MNSINNFYQHIPDFFEPVAFSVGSLSVYWYSLMWLTAFLVVYFLLWWRIKKKEATYEIDFIQNLAANALIGALIGGRLGYVLFYDLGYYIENPLSIISPYDFATGAWTGIYGMSYHGGIIGVVLAIALTANKSKTNTLKLFDFIVPAVPLGFMFGRIGNFFNEELVGHITSSPFGMYFNNEQILRHPSQLYEAFLEGLFLFLVLWIVRNRNLSQGLLSSLYLMGYAAARFFVEFFREPDAHIGYIMGLWTMGQILSLIMFSVGLFIFIKSIRSK